MNSTCMRAACAWPDLRLALARLAFVLAALPGMAPAWAGRPMASDDAAILAPGDCQVEAWALRTDTQREWWALPACGIGGWELAAGGGRMRADGLPASQGGTALQAKTVFRTLEPGGWGAGLAVSVQNGSGRARAVNIPLSVSLAGDALLLHLNAGWQRQQGLPGRPIWSAGSEYVIAPRWAVSLETYGSRQRPPTRQLGLRYTLVAGEVDLDASLASTRGARPQLAFGLTWALPHLLY